MKTAINQDDRILRPKEASQKTGLCLSHLYALSATDKFPKTIRLVPGGRASGFLESEVNPVSYTHLTLPTNREV